MKMRETFKNPDDASEGSELDELVSDADEYDLPPVEMDAENDLDASLDDVEDINEGGISESDSSLFEPSGTDDSMTDSEDDGNETNKDYKNVNAGECNSAGYDGPGSSGGNAQRCGKNNNHEKDNEDDDLGCVHDYNEDEEDDDTIRAIIAAIKKPRTVPPEIKIDDFITDICFHPVCDIIALGTITGDVCLYKYSNEVNSLLRNIEVHAKACRDVEFTEDGCNLLTCSKDKSIMITDMETEKLKKFYETAHDEAINKLHVIDENLFATGDDGGTVKLWDLRTKDSIFALKEVEDYITGMLTNDAKKLLLVTSGDGYLTTLNIGARKLYVQSEPYEEELTCMGLYRADSKLVVGTSKGRLYTYNWGQFGYHCDTYPGIKTPLSEMIPITDRVGCVAGEEGIIRAVHITPFRNLGIVGQHNMPIESIDISCTGELIASSSHNNDVRFWNVKYFEDFGEIKYNEKHNNFKDRRHNLPSSRVGNAGDFFADLAKEDNNGDGN